MQLDQLPAAIVAPVQALVQELSAWADAHADSTLAAQEQAVVSALQTAAPRLLAGLIQTTQRGLRPAGASARPRCPRCGGRTQRHSWRPRHLLTRCGPVQWERPWLRCPPCGHGFAPTDATLDLHPHQRLSAGLQSLVVALGTTTTFREAAWVLEQTTGVVLGVETVRFHTEAVGAERVVAHQHTAAQVQSTEQPTDRVERPPGRLVVETDGVMVRYLDGWHEVKIGIVGGWVAMPTVAAGGRLVGASYVATRAPAATFAAQWGADAARRGALTVIGWRGRGRGVAVFPTVVVLGDGAHWIWEAAAEQFGARIEIVDYYHASEHVWTVARAVYGEGTPATMAWAQATARALLTQGAEAVVERLRHLPPLPADAATVVRRERGYFTTNQARMAYPSFRAAGLPIGSGAVESSAQHLVQQRMKRPGQRWSEAGAQALLALRAERATQLAAADLSRRPLSA